MATGDLHRKLAAILIADVKEYTRLMRDDEGATVRTPTEYRGVMNGLIAQHHGRVVDSPGDNMLAEFASAVDAVQGAVAIQRELGERNAGLPDHRKMHFRIGINLGDVIVEGEQIYGDGLNIRIPLQILRAGAKLSALLPEYARDRVNEAIKQKGCGFDLSTLDGDQLEKLLVSLVDASIDLEERDRTVRISCE